MLDMLEKPHRSADEDKGYCDKAKNGSAQLLSLLRKHHAEVMQEKRPKLAEPESISGSEISSLPAVIASLMAINEPVDPVKTWVERQKAIPLPKSQWFSVGKELGAVVPRAIQVEDIIKAVGRHYGIARNEILSVRRDKDVVLPRQVAVYLCKQLTSRSLPEIGRRMGRDHTTILHSVRRINQRLAEDNGLAEEIAEIKREILA
jgi:chromosomal replication initiation ATPase DnaA